MLSLTERAERALLGALLQSPHLASQIRAVRPRDLANGPNSQMFAALTGRSRTAGCAAQVAEPWLRARLRRACPDPDHIRAYAAMVLEAAIRRRLAALRTRIADDTAELSGQTSRLAEVSSAPFEWDYVASGLAGLARLAAGEACQDECGEPQMRMASGLLNLPDPGRRQRRPAAVATDGVARGEARVLAAIIRQDDAAAAIPRWLPVAAFRPGPRRELYRHITHMYITGKPVDELTVDWERACGEHRDRDTGYAARLAAVHVDIADAVCIAYLMAVRARGEIPAEETCSPSR